MASADLADLQRLGIYVRERRQALGLSQTQFGQRLGWMQERVSLLENGKYGIPSLPSLARLAISCEVRLIEILAAAGYGDDEYLEAASWTADHPNDPALLYTLQRLLAIDAGTMKDALDGAADLVAGVMGADKIDAFIYEPAIASLVAVGASNTDMGRRQRDLGLDRVPIANRGREVEVFESGEAYLTGDAGNDPGMLVGMVDGLGIQSLLAVPLSVDGMRRGVLTAASAQPDQFRSDDLPFFETVARWVGMTAHRAELMEEVQRDAVAKARRTGTEELLEYLGRDAALHLEPATQRLETLRQTLMERGHSGHATELGMVQEHVSQVQRLIEDLLDASALERGLVPLKVEITDLVGLVREVIQQYRDTPAPIYVRAPEQLQAELDATRIRRAVDAMIRNAVRRTPGAVPVVVEIGVVHREDGDRVLVSVQDEGTSVDVAALPDYGGNFATPIDSSQLGLDLYHARSAAEAHGGMVMVETPSVSTAIFRLSLPLAPGKRPGN